MTKTPLAMILAAAVLSVGCSKTEAPKTSAATKAPCAVAPVDADLARQLHLRAIKPETDASLPGGLLPGCYTVGTPKSELGKNMAVYFSHDGQELGTYAPAPADSAPKGAYEWRSAQNGHRRVYANSDPRSFFAEQFHHDGMQHTMWGKHHRPVYLIQGNKLLLVNDDESRPLRNYADGHKTLEVKPGIYLVVEHEDQMTGKRIRNGKKLTINDACRLNFTCAVEQGSYSSRK